MKREEILDELKQKELEMREGFFIKVQKKEEQLRDEEIEVQNLYIFDFLQIFLIETIVYSFLTGLKGRDKAF